MGGSLRIVACLSCAACGPGEPHRLHFTDVTATSGIDLALTSGRTPATQILEVKGTGLALLDRDGDGDLDLFAPNGATLDSPGRGPGARLFDNLGELHFEDATGRAGIELSRWGMGVAVGDADGDGWEDLFVACFGENALLLNRAGAGFDERTREAGLAHEAWGMAAAFGDLDADGDLDLYVVNYLAFDPGSPPPPSEFLGVEVFAGPAGLTPAPDLLYSNLGDGMFADVTELSGCGAAPASFGLGAVVVDLDADGLQDVFVGNDSMRNFLFHNRGGMRFAEVGLRSGVSSNADGRDQATMGIAIADVTGNGLPDVFTSNFAADTNTLHVNRGELSFADRTQPWGLGMVSRRSLGWASMFHDFDRDADEDLLVFNGHVYPEAVTAQLGMETRQRPLLLEREGDAFRRVDAATAGSWLDEPRVDRGAAFGDLDGDGDVDVVVAELSGGVRVLRNDAGTGHWLVVELLDRGSRNPRALGARVEVDDGERRQVRWIHSGSGFQSASALHAHFGLGAHSAAVELTVVWPDGERQVLESVAVDRSLVVERD